MNPLARHIRAEIERRGPMSFSRFMEMALYTPKTGYYERQGAIGRGGDYFTSVSTGSLFGELLAWQFAQWLERLPVNSAACVQIVEAGAYGGQLAADILRWLRQSRLGLYSRLEYWLVEPSPVRRGWQEKLLAEFAPNVRWAGSVSEPGGVCGVIFSNELLDAMPTHRLRWNAAERKWEEWRVGVEGEGFVWIATPLPSDLEPYAPEIPAELAAVLPDGFTTEISPAAMDWWRQAGLALGCGKLLTFDYGLLTE